MARRTGGPGVVQEIDSNKTVNNVHIPFIASLSEI
jgi:hypothetical protein